MGTIDLSIPDDLWDAFNTAFAGQDANTVIAELMRQAVEHAVRQQRSRAAIGHILKAHSNAPVRSLETLRSARLRGRP